MRRVWWRMRCCQIRTREVLLACLRPRRTVRGACTRRVQRHRCTHLPSSRQWPPSSVGRRRRTTLQQTRASMRSAAAAGRAALRARACSGPRGPRWCRPSSESCDAGGPTQLSRRSQQRPRRRIREFCIAWTWVHGRWGRPSPPGPEHIAHTAGCGSGGHGSAAWLGGAPLGAAAGVGTHPQTTVLCRFE